MSLRGPISGALVAAILGVFSQVREHEFVNFDDRETILNNPTLDLGFSAEGIAAAFGFGYPLNWIPLTTLSLQLDRALYGTDPAGTLLTNVGLHTAATLLLFSALCRMTGAVGRSGFVAALFALHPLHVESVAWASERKDVLAGCFWMLTLLAWARYCERPERWRYRAVLATFCCGLMAKPSVVTLPFALLLLDYWPLHRLRDRNSVIMAVGEKLPMIGLAAAASAGTYFVQRAAGQMAHRDALPVSLRVGNAIESYVAYLGSSLWPSGLAAYYPHPLDALSPARVAISGALLLAICSLVWVGRRRSYLVVGWLWFLGTLVPVIGLVQVSLQARADRYMYVPLVGLGIALAWGASDAFGTTRRGRTWLAGLGCAACGALALVSHGQVQHWRDSMALFERAHAVTDANYFAHNGLGFALLESSRTHRLLLAETHFREAIRLEPRWAMPHRGLAITRLQQGEPEGAIAPFLEALAIAPDDASAHEGLGTAMAEAERYDEAFRHLERAHTLGRDSVLLLARIGTAAARSGRRELAARYLREARRRRPGWAPVEKEIAALEAARAGRTAEPEGDANAGPIPGGAPVQAIAP